MAKSIAIIGDSESIKGFGAVGMDRFVCEVPSESAQLLKQLTDNDYYAIIYMTEEIFEASAKEREKFAERETPAIIPPMTRTAAAAQTPIITGIKLNLDFFLSHLF